MQVKEGKRAFAKRFKGLKRYMPQELLENKYNFAAFWKKWIEDNAYKIGKKNKKEKKNAKKSKLKKKLKQKKKKKQNCKGNRRKSKCYFEKINHYI